MQKRGKLDAETAIRFALDIARLNFNSDMFLHNFVK